MLTKLIFEINNKKYIKEYDFETEVKEIAKQMARKKYNEYLEKNNILHDIFLGQILAEPTILFTDDENYYQIDNQYDNEETSIYIPIDNNEV